MLFIRIYLGWNWMIQINNNNIIIIIIYIIQSITNEIQYYCVIHELFILISFCDVFYSLFRSIRSRFCVNIEHAYAYKCSFRCVCVCVYALATNRPNIIWHTRFYLHKSSPKRLIKKRFQPLRLCTIVRWTTNKKKQLRILFLSIWSGYALRVFIDIFVVCGAHTLWCIVLVLKCLSVNSIIIILSMEY